MSRFEALLRAALSLVLLGVWLLLLYCPPIGGPGTLLDLIKLALAGLIGHSLRPVPPRTTLDKGTSS